MPARSRSDDRGGNHARHGIGPDRLIDLAEGRSSWGDLTLHSWRISSGISATISIPGMLFLDFCAASMRNWHFREFWMRSALRGSERAMVDGDFARIAGAGFGGLNVHPLGILRQIGTNILRYLGEGAMQAPSATYRRKSDRLRQRCLETSSHGRARGSAPPAPTRSGTRPGWPMSRRKPDNSGRRCWPRRTRGSGDCRSDHRISGDGSWPKSQLSRNSRSQAPMSTEKEVAIVGGGIAGLTARCACWSAATR